MLLTAEAAVLQAWVKFQGWLGKRARWLGFFGLSAAAILTVGTRCLRLADPNYYYLYSPDSYFFHWVAQRVMAGEGPPIGSTGANYTIHSGLAYPMAYIAKGVGYAFSLSPEESLALVAKSLPPALALVTLIILYIGVSRIWGRRVALFAALAWALFYYAVFVGVAGYVDRDGLSVLLLLLGVLVFYFFKDYRAYLGKMNVGWLLSGFGVLAVEVLLYLEWGLTGAALLLAILLVYVVLRFLLEYLAVLDTQPNTMLRILAAGRKLELWPLSLIAVVNVIAIAVIYHNASWWFPHIWSYITSRFSGTASQGAAAEVTGLTPWDLVFGFQFFLIVLALGIYRAWKSKDEASILFTGWFVSFTVLSLLAWRLLLYAVPATCIVAGLGFTQLLEWRKRGAFPISKTLAVAIVAIMVVVLSFSGAASLNGGATMSPDKDWQDALTYLRESTPSNAVVMSQWSYGYWILDLGQRTPFVDNGYYAPYPDMLYDVGRVYFTNDPSEAAQIMAKRGAEYLVFSEDDLNVAATIMQWASIEGYELFPGDSLVIRSLNGEFVSGGGLEVVFHNEEVVILRLGEADVAARTMHE